MSTHRRTGESLCPLDDKPADMDTCQPCRFFRGAASYPGDGRVWTVICNWPRNGRELAVMEKPGPDIAIPDAFRDAFGPDEANGGDPDQA